MKILVAEDDPISRELMRVYLGRWGYEPLLLQNGAEALAQLIAPDAPMLAILDWMMPEKDGLQVCREVRAANLQRPLYIILLTAKSAKDDLLQGFEAGADDYVTKPFEPSELRARVRAGVRIVELQTALSDRIHELEEAMSRIKTLQGLLPICAWCKKVRDEKDYWQRVETYVASHTEARFTHSICPECKQKQLEIIKQQAQSRPKE